MIIDYLYQHYKTVLFKIDRFTARKNWQIELTLLIPIIVLFFSFPSYEFMFDEHMSNWKYLFEQAANPFAQHNYDPNSHQAKLTFRLFVPLLIRFFHLNIIGVYALLFICGIATVFFYIKSVLKITENKTITVILTLAFASTAICKNPFIDILGYLDGFALFFLIIPFAFSNPLLIFSGVFFAAWVDERGLVASCLIFGWIFFIKKSNTRIVETIAVVLAWLAYFMLRFYLAKHFNLVTHTDAVGIGMLLNQVNNAPLGIWTGLEGFWILIILSLIIFYKKKDKLIAFLFLAGISLIVLIALSVSDITRSMIYLFPCIFIALYVIKNTETENNMLYISSFVFILSAISPQFIVGGYNTVMWLFPFPLQMLRYIAM